MIFTEAWVKEFVACNYNLSVLVERLPGEVDLNFHLKDKQGDQFVLKIAHYKSDRQILEFQNAMMTHINHADTGLKVQRVIRSREGMELVPVIHNEKTFWVRMLSWMDGSVLAEVKPHSNKLLFKLGEMCGKLAKSLVGFDHPGAHRWIKWDPSQAFWVGNHLHLFKGEQRRMIDYCFEMYTNVAPLLPSLRKSVNYNDANDYNVLVVQQGMDVQIPGVIDFGDAVYTNTINELAIAAMYAMLNKPDPLNAAFHVVQGYHQHFPLQQNEVSVLYAMILCRLLISVTCAANNRIENPDNNYLQITDSGAWNLLDKLQGVSPAFATSLFRYACGYEPCQDKASFNEWIKLNFQKFSLPVKSAAHHHWLDLSAGSMDLANSLNEGETSWQKQVETLMRQQKMEVALGRYNEARALYKDRDFSYQGNDEVIWRTVSMGIDFFTKAAVPVSAVFSGKVLYKATDTREHGNVIVLHHEINKTLSFYTLYGGLSAAFMEMIKLGSEVIPGEQIGVAKATEGTNIHNFHLMVVLDWPGSIEGVLKVVPHHQREVYKSLYPDPWLLFSGEESNKPRGREKDEIVSFRKKHVGKNMSISYQEPIKMVRGMGAYLVDDTGRKYLDTVNNVAHVGHEHPRVVTAGQRQMAVLNTNTRYLHDNLVEFVEELLTTFPPSLDVAFLVNSGSEANELAMRLAKNYTGQKDWIVSEVGYHGNTNGCIDISSYKFDGAGGKGKPEYTHVLPIPDLYRGLYRASDPHASSKYISHLQEVLDQLHQNKSGPAALIFESIISCGGQVELPDNFLAEAYKLVRKAGGLCIADEVQTGCGRVGSHFWAFQQHDVVPDIVTIGKPIGNGHPLGVVITTQAIADAFKNGMEYFNTFGGNPVSCAIGLEVLRVIKDEQLQVHAASLGDYLKHELNQMATRHEIIGDVRGPGLFMGVELVKDQVTKIPATAQASYLANRMRDKGILMSTDGPFNNVMKIKPPLVFSRNDADFLLTTMDSVLSEDFMKKMNDNYTENV